MLSHIDMRECNGIFGRKLFLIRTFFQKSLQGRVVSGHSSADKHAHSRQSSQLPLVFWGLLLLAFALRVPGLTRPLLGNFSTKSVVYAMMVRNWAEGRAALWQPTIDCLVGGRRSLHMAEFPVSAYLTGLSWRVLGGSLDVWGRATAVAFSVASVGLLYLLARRCHGPRVALGAGLTLALSPVAVIYGQNFMIDASMVFFALAAWYGVVRWLDSHQPGWLLLGSLSFCLLVLSKFYLAAWLLPLTAMLLWPQRFATPRLVQDVEHTFPTGFWPLYLLAAAVAMVPGIVWYTYVYRMAMPESPWAPYMYTSLQRNAQGSPLFDRMLWNPDFYRQLLDDWTGVVLTPIGFVLLLAGFLDRTWRQYILWFVAAAVVVAAMPVKFFKANYYYVALLPPFCILAGLGWQVLQERLPWSRRAVVGLLAIWVVFSLRYSVRPAFVTPEEDRAVVAAGLATEKLTAPDEPIVTMHGDAIDLLYYCNRPGWAIPPDVPDLADVLRSFSRQGARYLVVVSPASATIATRGQTALASVEPAARGEGYAVYRLAR